MTQQVVRGGSPIDIPSVDEIGAEMDARMAAFYEQQREIASARERERLRGLKRIEIFIPLTGVSTVFIGQYTNAGMGNGPEQGYVWSIRLVSMVLASAGTMTIYKSSSDKDTRRPLFAPPQIAATTGTIQVATWSSDQARIRFGEGLYITATQNINSVYMAAWELPAEREGEFA